MLTLPQISIKIDNIDQWHNVQKFLFTKGYTWLNNAQTIMSPKKPNKYLSLNFESDGQIFHGSSPLGAYQQYADTLIMLNADEVNDETIPCANRDRYLLATDGNYDLVYNPVDNTYTAGCRKNYTYEEALKHWETNSKRALPATREKRAEIFVKALLAHKKSIRNTIPKSKEQFELENEVTRLNLKLKCAKEKLKARIKYEEEQERLKKIEERVTLVNRITAEIKKDNGDWKIDWSNRKQNKYTILYDVIHNTFTVENFVYYRHLNGLPPIRYKKTARRILKSLTKEELDILIVN